MMGNLVLASNLKFLSSLERRQANRFLTLFPRGQSSFTGRQLLTIQGNQAKWHMGHIAHSLPIISKTVWSCLKWTCFCSISWHRVFLAKSQVRLKVVGSRQVTSLAESWTVWLLLIKAGGKVSSSEVYQRYYQPIRGLFLQKSYNDFIHLVVIEGFPIIESNSTLRGHTAFFGILWVTLHEPLPEG